MELVLGIFKEIVVWHGRLKRFYKIKKSDIKKECQIGRFLGFLLKE